MRIREARRCVSPAFANTLSNALCLDLQKRYVVATVSLAKSLSSGEWCKTYSSLAYLAVLSRHVFAIMPANTKYVISR